MKHGYHAALAFVLAGTALGVYTLFGPEQEMDPTRPTYQSDPNAAMRERCQPYEGQMNDPQAYTCAIAVWDRVHYTALKTGADISTDRALRRECFHHFTLPSYNNHAEGARDLFNRSAACLREAARIAAEPGNTGPKAQNTRQMVAGTQRDIANTMAKVPGFYRR